MKKALLFTLLLGLSGFLTSQNTMANTHIENSKQTISTLSFKEIMRTFYAERLEKVFVVDDDITQLPYVGIGKTEEYNLVAVMHPAINYKGNDGLERYFVLIEKVEIDEDGNLGNSCHACTAKADLLLFKKNIDGEYQLISYSQDDELLPSSYGRIHFDTESIQKNIHLLGRNLYGSFYEFTYYNHGYSESSWEILHFNENNFIKTYNTYDNMNLLSGESNVGTFDDEDSPLAFSYESSIQVQNNQTTYFPLNIIFKGDKQLDNGRITKYNTIQTIQYQPAIDKYQIIK